MNTQTKIYVIGVTAAAAGSALVTSAIYNERMRKLKNELNQEKFVSEVLLDAAVRTSAKMTKQEFIDTINTSMDRIKFERIVKINKL
jgi:hypothetical protein